MGLIYSQQLCSGTSEHFQMRVHMESPFFELHLTSSYYITITLIFVIYTIVSGVVIVNSNSIHVFTVIIPYYRNSLLLLIIIE